MSNSVDIDPLYETAVGDPIAFLGYDRLAIVCRTDGVADGGFVEGVDID